MKKLLVIGATGLLGSAVVELGKTVFDSVVGTYNTKEKEGYIKLDVRNRKEVFDLITKEKPSLIVDTHALNNVDYCETHPEEAWDINVDGTKNVAEASKVVGAKYVFISSDYVFSGFKTEYIEKDKPDPVNYYGKTKFAAELMLKALDINHIAIRTSSLYGARSSSDKKSFPVWLIESLKANKQVDVAIDQYVSPTNVDNLSEVIFKLYEKDAVGIFHATGSDCVSKFEYAKEIADVFNLNSKLIRPVTSAQLNLIAKRPGKVILKTDKTRRITGMVPIGIKEGLDLIKKGVNI